MVGSEERPCLITPPITSFIVVAVYQNVFMEIFSNM